MTRAISRSLRTATMPPGNWPDGHRPLVDARGNVVGIVAAKVLAHGHRVRRRRWRPPGRCRSPCGRPPSELRGEEQSAPELPGVGAGRGGKTQGAEYENESFEEVVKSAQGAAVLVLIY